MVGAQQQQAGAALRQSNQQRDEMVLKIAHHTLKWTGWLSLLLHRWLLLWNPLSGGEAKAYTLLPVIEGKVSCTGCPFNQEGRHGAHWHLAQPHCTWRWSTRAQRGWMERSVHTIEFKEAPDGSCWILAAEEEGLVLW